MTTEQATSLKEALESMLDHIAKKQAMADDLQQIERLHKEFAPTAPAMLNHYLQRRSYTKALDFLKQGYVVENASRPDCDH